MKKKIIKLLKIIIKLPSYIYFFIIKTNKKNAIIVPPQGFGDILYIMLGLSRSRKKYYVVVLRKQYKELCNLFPHIVKKTFYLPRLKSFKNIRLHHGTIYKKGSYKSLLDIFEKNLKRKINLDKPPIHSFCSKRVEKYFIKNDLKQNKVVLISPEANSCPAAKSKYWVKYAAFIRKKGYTPIFNSKKKYGNFKSVFLNLNDTIAFANKAGNVVGYRSGLCDVLSYYCDINFVFIYPKTQIDYNKLFIRGFDKNRAEKWKDFCSLKKMYPNKKIKECIIKENVYYIN